MRFRLKQSLLTKYLIIIFCAMLLLPLMFPLVSIVLFYPLQLGAEDGDELYRDGKQLESMWHLEAQQLDGAEDAAIDKRLSELKAVYSKASMFWVDKDGVTRTQLPVNPQLPAKWTAAYTLQFMKERIGGDPFTVVAFIESDKQGRFMVFELPRSYMVAQGVKVREYYGTIFSAGAIIILGLFLFVSFMFFYRIRKRLVRLRWAMTSPAAGGIPTAVEVQNKDEIGELESAFNDMIRKLEAGRLREAEEEALRRELIAKLSHDLRTPLTAIRSHAFGLRKERLTEQGTESVALIERKIDYLGQLIENLFSYSLLSAGRYPYRPKQVDIVRMTRTMLASWYPLFEQEGFDIQLSLPDEAVNWEIDPAWLERVLDNYFQNVLRHAREGRYISVSVVPEGGGAITIGDHGPGMGAASLEKGTGLGLSIIRLMVKEMSLDNEVKTGPNGTQITISPRVVLYLSEMNKNLP
ncbi:HAMP domain-containing sensor histidine kinase [Paenibacillus sp. GXUN7292]|uniref:HAMP domain-containing sensor histidine kinase n=1 Tax=Paenibacillus sp. GXUN7292 TaxID=3422499 RepID=UPI003D7D436A